MSTADLLPTTTAADYPAATMPSFPPSTHSSATTTSWRPFKHGITSLTIDIPQPRPRSRAPLPSTGDVPRRRTEVQPHASRWRSKEFCAYYAVFVVAVPYMAKVVIDLSRGESLSCRIRVRELMREVQRTIPTTIYTLIDYARAGSLGGRS